VVLANRSAQIQQLPDEDVVETEEELLAKQKFMHPEG